MRVDERAWTEFYCWKTSFLGFGFMAIEAKLSADCHGLAHLLPLAVNSCPYLPPDSDLALSLQLPKSSGKYTFFVASVFLLV